MIEIFKNVPLPEKQSGQKSKYPFDDMDVGDCFFAGGNQSSFSSLAAHYKPKKFTTRTVVCDGQTLIGVWRIE